MFNFTKAQITKLFTTSNALGSFTGNQIPNLQINELEPGEYTLQFQQVEPVIDGSNQATYAIVRWKVQGQQIQRIISVFSGAVLTGVAEAVDVMLLDQSERTLLTTPLPTFATVTNGSDTVPLTQPVVLAADEQLTFATQPAVTYALAGPVNGTSIILATPYTGPTSALVRFIATASYKVAVSLSRGTRPTIMQPPVLLTTRSISVPASTVSPPLFIPIDAGIISAFITVDVVGGAGTAQAEAANARVLLVSVGGNALTRFIPQPTPGWYPIPPGTDSISFVNDSTTKDLNFSIQWGIEG